MKTFNTTPDIHLPEICGRNLFILVLLGLAFLAAPGRAADVVKTNNTDSLNLGSSWTGGAPPTSADVAVWDSNITAANTVDLGASTNWAGIRLSGVGGAVTINNPATTLTLGAQGIDTSASAYPLTNGCPLIAGAPQNWNLLPALTITGGLSGAAASGNDVTLTSGTLYIAGSGMTLSNLVLNTGATLVPQTSSGRGIVTLNGGTFSLTGPSVMINNDIYVSAGGGYIKNNNSRQWYGNLTGSGPLTAQVRGNFQRWGGDNRNYNGTINIGVWNGIGKLRIENLNAVSASTAYVMDAAGQNAIEVSVAGVVNLGSLAGGGYYTGDSVGYIQTWSGLNFSIGALNTDTTFSGNITGAGGIIKVGTGRLTLDHVVTAGSYTGFTIISNGVLQVGNGGASGLLGGSVTNYSKLVFNIGNNYSQTFANLITGTGNVTNIGSGTVALTGANHYSGVTVITAGTLEIGSASQLTNTIVVGDNATLGALPATASATVTEGAVNFGSGCAYEFNLGTLPNPTSTSVVSNTGTITFNGNVAVNLMGTNTSLDDGTITLLKYAGRSGTGSFVLGSLPVGITNAGPGLVDDTVNKELRLTIHVLPPPDLTRVWVGDAIGNWDIGNTGNKIWKVAYNGQITNYNDGVAVRFDDTATGTTNINLTTTLNPSAVTVTNNSKTYTFGGSGKLSGSTGLTKRGTGTLITTNANDYNGSTVIEDGTLVVAGQGAHLGGGGVTNYGTLVFDLSNAGASYTLPFFGQIVGTGGVTILGMDQNNSMVQMNIADAIGLGVAGNPYSGGTTLSNVYVQLVPNPYDPATARAAKSTGLGTNTITFLGTSTVEEPDWGVQTTTDFAGDFIAPIYVPSGQSGTFKTAGRTTVSSPVTGGGTFNLGVSWIRDDINCDFSAFTGQINVFPNGTADFRIGNAAGFPLAKLHLAAGLTAYSQAANNSIFRVGELSSEAGTVIGGGNNVTWQVGALNTDATNAANLTSGNVSIIKEGTGTWTLSGTVNDYSGNTTISNGVLALATDAGISNSPTISISSAGVLDVSATTSKTFALGVGGASQTLRGNGTIRGSLSVGSLGTVTPGFSIGTLTVTNAVTLGGAVVMELDRAGTPNSDRIIAPSFTGGGTLTVTNIGAALHMGDTFQLFSTNISGFATVNLETNDTVNYLAYTWTNRLAIDGTIQVLTAVQTINPNPPIIGFTMSGSTLTLSWPTNAGWILYRQTNSLSIGLSNNWVADWNSTNVTSTNITMDPNNGTVFYRMVEP